MTRKKPSKSPASSDDRDKQFVGKLGDLEFLRIARPTEVPAIGRDRFSKQNRMDASLQAIQRDLATLSESSEALLAGNKYAEEQLRNVLAAGVERFYASNINVSYDVGLLAGVIGLGENLSISKSCRNSLSGRIRALQAAFALDAMSKTRGVPLTKAANYLIGRSLDYIRNAGDQGPRAGKPGAPMPTDLAGSDGPGPTSRSDGFGDPIGPGTDGRGDPLDPGMDIQPPSFCDQLGELIGQAIVDWATGADVDPYTQLIGSLAPPCVAHDQVHTTHIRALPAEGKKFPEHQPDHVRLMLGDVDITGYIDLWAASEIRFYLPAGAHSAAVYLQGPFAARNGLSDTAIGKILDFGAFITGLNVRLVPGAAIGVIYPPEIRLFKVNGQEVAEEPIILESCRDSMQIVWQVGMTGTPGIGIPDCAHLSVELVDDGGNVLASSNSPVGAANLPPRQAGNTSFELIATIRFDGNDIGEVNRTLRLHFVRRLHLEMRVPTHPQLIGSQHATVRVSISCQAPHGGTRVNLQSSSAGVLDVPNFVTVPQGNLTADFVIYSRPGEHGQVTITAMADGHISSELSVEVIDPHTAIVLSGGGAKGDFEVGACSYLLHERWDELDVKSVIGTSVGSINTLGLATNDGDATAHVMEDQWLALAQNSDMFRTATWLLNIGRDSGIDVAAMLQSLAGGGGGGPGGFSLDGLGTLATALQIPIVGNILGALMGFFDSSDVSNFLTAADEGTHYLSGDRTDDNGQLIAASSVLVLDPTAQRLARSIDDRKITAGGLRVRLCMVALDDGNVYYLDERGHLLRSAKGDIIDEAVSSFGFAPYYSWISGSRLETLVAGSMASSAIPFFFAPVRLSTGRRSLTMVDGGVRDVLPTRAAIDLGARLIIAVATGVPDVNQKDVISKANLIDIALRGINIQGSEVAWANRREPAGTCRSDAEMVLIQPRGDELHGTFQIDSGLIRINLAYGWMRAFDEFLQRENPAQYDDVYQSTESIVQQRSTIWQREEQALLDMLHSPRPAFGMPNARNPNVTDTTCNLTSPEVTELRMLKRDLFQLVYSRFSRFGEASLPKGFGTPGDVRSERIYDWWEQWEHVDPRPTPPGTAAWLSLPGQPFDQQTLWDPNSGVAQRESSPPPLPMVPADFVAAMTF
jgi:NTE family protein